MAKTVKKPVVSAAISEADLISRFKDPVFDPAPEWIRIDEGKLREFGKLQIQHKLKELELAKQKIEQLGKLM